MHRWGVSAPIEASRIAHLRVWVVAVLFFGIGDVATTTIGLGFESIEEVGILTAPLIDQYGLGAMVVLKVAVFAACFAFWRYMPRPQRVGIPLGLAILGVWVTGWNMQMVLTAVIA